MLLTKISKGNMKEKRKLKYSTMEKAFDFFWLQLVIHHLSAGGIVPPIPVDDPYYTAPASGKPRLHYGRKWKKTQTK